MVEIFISPIITVVVSLQQYFFPILSFSFLPKLLCIMFFFEIFGYFQDNLLCKNYSGFLPTTD